MMKDLCEDPAPTHLNALGPGREVLSIQGFSRLQLFHDFTLDHAGADLHDANNDHNNERPDTGAGAARGLFLSSHCLLPLEIFDERAQEVWRVLLLSQMSAVIHGVERREKGSLDRRGLHLH